MIFRLLAAAGGGILCAVVIGCTSPTYVPPPARPAHVTIRLHHNTYSPAEQTVRVDEVIQKLRRQGVTDVVFYIDVDTDTPRGAIDRLLAQLKESGYLKSQIRTTDQ